MADNPYAEYAAPTTDNPYAAFAAPANNPYAAFEASVRASNARAAQPDTSLTQNVKVAARAAYPYATAAGLGAMAGAPFGGPVGSAAGAGLATLGLGLGDIGTAGYNVLAKYLGGQRVALPSETIQNLYGAAGLGAEPQTSEQRMLANAVSGAMGAGAQARALNALAPLASSPTTRNVMTTLGQQPNVQAAAGAGGAAVPTAMQEYADITDPYALMGGSLVGSMLGAKTGAAVADRARGAANLAQRGAGAIMGEGTPTPADLKSRAQASFTKAENAGAAYRADAFDNFATNAIQKLESKGYFPDNPRYADLRGPLARIEELRNNPQSISELHDLRQRIGNARTSPDKDTRRLAGMLTDELDAYIANTKNAVAGAESATSTAGKALREGINDWSKLSKSDEIERLIARARLSTADPADALRTQFASLARNENRMRRFSEGEQAAIREVAEGKSGSAILNAVSKLAPSFDVKGLLRFGAAMGPGAYSGSPGLLGAGLAAATVGAGARTARNTLAELHARGLAGGMRRGDIMPPFEVNRMAVVPPAAQQMLYQMQQGE
jgi:hypothetical protein